jgi:hypothetical protein
MSVGDINLLVLAHTRDVDEAVWSANQLGQDLKYATCSVDMPGEWVLAQQEGSKARARWAVAHCSDPETLREVAANPLWRKRTRQALLGNPHLPDDVEMDITPKGMGEPWSKATGEGVYTKLEQLLTTPGSLRGVSSTDALALLRRVELARQGEYLDRMLEVYLGHGDPWMVTDLLLCHYVPNGERSREVGSLYRASGLTAEAALALAEQKSARVISVVGSLVEALTASEGAIVPLDGFVMECGIRNWRPLTQVGGRDAREWLSDEAWEKAIESVEWAKLLSAHLLSAEELGRVVARHQLEGKGEMLVELVHSEADYPFVPQLLEGMDEAVITGLQEGTSRFSTAVFASKDEALISRFIERCSIGLLEDLLLGDVVGSAQKVLLPVIWVERVVDTLLARGGEISVESVLTKLRENSLPKTYALELVATVPGVAWKIGENMDLIDTPAGCYVYTSLRESGASVPMIRELFSSQPEAALRQIVSALRLLVHAEKIDEERTTLGAGTLTSA